MPISSLSITTLSSLDISLYIRCKNLVLTTTGNTLFFSLLFHKIAAMMEAMSEKCAEEENMDLARCGQDIMEGKVCDP